MTVNRYPPAAPTAPTAVPYEPPAGRRPPATPEPSPVAEPGGARHPRGGSAIFWRLLVATAAAVVAVLAIVLGALALSARRSADAALARGLSDVRGHVGALLEGRTRALTSATLVFAQDPTFRSLVLERAPADLLDRAVEAVQRTGATWAQIADDDGVRVAKSDEPGAQAVSLANTALVGRALAGEVMAGAGIAGDTAVFEGVAVPVTVGAQVVGVLMVARTLDAVLAREIRAATASEVLVYLVDADGRPRAVASTLPASAHGGLLAGIEARRAHAAGTDSAGTGAAQVAAVLGGTALVGQETPLRSATGEVVGGVVTLRSRAVELAPFVDLRRRIVLAGGAGLALAFALAFVVARQITRPIVALTEAARRAAAGDYSGAGVSVASSGEVAELADAMRSVLSNLQERQGLAELVERARTLPDPAGDEPTVPHTPPAAFLPGATLAQRYTIDAVLGVGGNGVVYRATDRELGETVAIKTLRPEVLAGGPAALERLKDEIRLARRISHVGVVRIHDFGEADGAYFVTMEHVAGMSLAEALRRLGRVPVPQVIAIGKQLCGALGAAHAQGVIHRDVKPQNLMLQPDGTLKVLDFGVARLAERASGLTTAGLVVGTPAYMAPEQLLDEDVDGRVDVYATGVVLFEALTGRRPVEASNPAAVIARILSETAPSPRELAPDVPDALADAVLRALARDRDARPRTMAELHDLLARAGRAA